jgi:hypothetical protein
MCECPGNGVWNYTFTPRLQKLTNSKKEKAHQRTLYFGFEVEVETAPTRGVIKRGTEIVHRSPFLYCKSDTSIGHGFEIVSHPMTLSYIQKNIKVWSDIFYRLRDCGFLADSAFSCGMHVHMSKDSFSRLHLYRFLSLVYDHENFTKFIAERSGNWFDEYCGLKKEIPNHKAVKARQRNWNGDDDRHVAVNVNTSETVELRIFQSTLKIERFLKNIEFCHAAFWFTKNVGLRDTTPLNLCAFVAKKRKRYPNLFAFLVSNKLVKE